MSSAIDLDATLQAVLEGPLIKCVNPLLLFADSLSTSSWELADKDERDLANVGVRLETLITILEHPDFSESVVAEAAFTLRQAARSLSKADALWASWDATNAELSKRVLASLQDAIDCLREVREAITPISEANESPAKLVSLDEFAKTIGVQSLKSYRSKHCKHRIPDPCVTGSGRRPHRWNESILVEWARRLGLRTSTKDK